MNLARRTLLNGFIASAALSTLLPASAQLYARTPPPGSTFVRVANGTAVAGVPARIADQVLPGLPPFAASAYSFLPPGSIEVAVAGTTAKYSLLAGHYYTVAHTADGAKLFDLQGFTSQLKSMIVLFNLLPDTTLSLKTADGKTTVFDNVGPYAVQQREINPLTVKLALFKGDQKIADVPPKTLERGQPASLMVSGSAATPSLIWEVQQ